MRVRLHCLRARTKAHGALWFIIIGVLHAPLISSGATVEDLLAEINGLPSAEREKRLTEGARKEGAVVLYTSEDVNLLRGYEKTFVKRYPFIKVEYWRAGGDRVGTRVLTEFRANKLETDLIGIAFDVVSKLERIGIFARYLSPGRKFIPDLFKDKEGRYAPTNLIHAVIVYNTHRVARENAPKEYAGLLNPAWQGSLTIDTEPSRAVLGWLKTWGEAETRKYAQGLVRNKVVVNRGHTLQAQLLCAGEYKIAVELYLYRAAQMKQRGCPIAFVYPNPTPVASAQSWGIPVTTSRPHAAALFLDFLLSEEGAKLVAGEGRIPVRIGVEPANKELSNLNGKGVRLEFTSPEDAYQLGDVAAKIIKNILLRQ